MDLSDNIYVAGAASNNAFRITPAGAATQIIDATGDGAGNLLDGPSSIAVDSSGNVYVAGFYSRNVFRIAADGTITEIIDANGDGSGNPGYSIPPEFSKTLAHKPGAVAMARTPNPASAGCQFYICLGSPTHLDGKYTIFGQVIEGKAVVDKIGKVRTGYGNRPVEKVG